jgi:hypothetical protein
LRSETQSEYRQFVRGHFWHQRVMNVAEVN